MNLKVRTLAALALAALVSALSPSVALAAHHHRHVDRASYPMKADEFRQLMEKRIDSVRAAIDRKLDKRGVSAERKKAIHKIFDDAAKDVRAEMNRAAAKGTVDREDAENVKTLASGLRARVRQRLRAEKNPKLKDKLAREEAKRKERAAAREAVRKKAAPTGVDAGPKTAKATAPAEGAAKPKAAKTVKAAKPATHDKGPSGPTRTAKVPATKKKAPPKEDPGSDL